MVKALIFTLSLLGVGHFGFQHIKPESSTEHDLVSEGLEQIKETNSLSLEEMMKVSQYGSGEDSASESDQGDIDSDSLLEDLEDSGDFINPNTMQIDEFIYSVADKRDPFLPFDLSKRVKNDIKKYPLTAYSLGQLRVTAILGGADGTFTAIVEDNSGKGYTIKPGSKIGNAGGEVVEIEEKKVKVLESYVNFNGEEVNNVVEMKIYRGK